MITRLDLDELAHTHRLVPITRTLFADAETPVGVYRKLAAGRSGTFLLESAEPGASFSRWSFVGVHCASVLTEREGKALWLGDGLPTTSSDPLEALREAAVTRSLYWARRGARSRGRGCPACPR